MKSKLKYLMLGNLILKRQRPMIMHWLNHFLKTKKTPKSIRSFKQGRVRKELQAYVEFYINEKTSSNTWLLDSK